MAKIYNESKNVLDILYIDLEAQYKATIDHVKVLIDECSDVLEDVYWCCLPLSLRNAVSVIQPKWICWDKKDKAKWVRKGDNHERKKESKSNIQPKRWNS